MAPPRSARSARHAARPRRDGLERVEDPGQPVGRGGRVVVDVGDVLAAGLPPAEVAGARQADPRLRQVPQARRPREAAVDQLAGAVGRAVVDHQDLVEVRRQRLGGQARERAAQQIGPIAGADDGRDGRTERRGGAHRGAASRRRSPPPPAAASSAARSAHRARAGELRGARVEEPIVLPYLPVRPAAARCAACPVEEAQRSTDCRVDEPSPGF